MAMMVERYLSDFSQQKKTVEKICTASGVSPAGMLASRFLFDLYRAADAIASMQNHPFKYVLMIVL